MVTAPETIVTDRLVLRRPSPSDAEAVYEYGSDPLVTRFMDWPTHTHLGTVFVYLEGADSSWRSGEEFNWVVTAKPNDVAIGGLSCRIRGEAADFGFVLNRRYSRLGYATEAALAIVDWASRLESVHRIWATCDAGNMASARVLEKLRLVPEGVLHRWMIRPNISPEPRDALIYARVRTIDG